MEPRRRQLAWAVAAAAGVLLTFAPATLGLRTLSQRDTDSIYGPVRTLVVEALRAGRLPLWNPYEGMGRPLFAEGIHSVLHPVSLLGALVAPASVDFLILGYLVVAALGAFLLARGLGASAAAGAGAALSFALSGYSVSMSGNLVFLAGLSTLPWLLAALRAAGAGARWGAVATAAATACAFLSGDAQVALVGLALGLPLALDAGGRRALPRALAGITVGLLLAGVQLAATRGLLPLTTRGLDLDPEEGRGWPLAPARLLEWIVPGLFRGPLATLPTTSSGEQLRVFAESVYVGAPLVAAAAFALARGRRRTAALLGAAALALLWLALGHHLGARQLLGWVPVWSRFRYPEKLMAPLSLCLAALGALGVDRFAETRLGPAWARTLGGLALASAAAWGALAALPGATSALATSLLGDAGPFYRSTLAGGLPHLALALVALLAVDRLRAAGVRAAGLALLCAATAAAATPFGAHLGDLAARRAASPLPLASDGPTARLAHPADALVGVAEDADAVDMIARAYSLLLYPAANVARRVDTIEPYGAFRSRRLWALGDRFGAEWARAFRRYGLTHVALPFPWRDDARREAIARAVAGGALVQRDVRRGFELWAVPHRPWATFAERAIPARDAGEAERLVVDRLLLGDDGAVVVEAPAPPATAPGRVLRVERGTGSATIEAEAAGPALLVVQDAWWPGWRATIDGRPAPLLAADLLVRAVPWPRGRHRLELTYDPPELRTGLALSAVGALLLGALAILALRRPPPHPDPLPRGGGGEGRSS